MFESEECPRLAEVRAFWDGELHGEAIEDLQRHLEHCGACASEYRESQRFAVLLEAGDEADPLPDGRREAMRAAVLEACEPPARPAWGWFGDWRREATSWGGSFRSKRRAAWVLAPMAAGLLLTWVLCIQRPGEPTAPPGLVKAPGDSNGARAIPRQVQKNPPRDSAPRTVDENRGGPTLPQPATGPNVAERAPRRRAPQVAGNRNPVRLARGRPSPEAGSQREPEHPVTVETKRVRTVRVATTSSASPAARLREHVVVLAEGSAFGKEGTVAEPPSLRIIAAGGSAQPAGTGVILWSKGQGDQP